MSTITNGADTIKLDDCTDCFAVPGASSIIDLIHPQTGRSIYCNETLEEIRLRHPGAVRTTVAAHCEAKAARQDTLVTWSSITKERFDDWFECLPPAAYGHRSFLIGEPADHHALSGRPRYTACRILNGEHQASDRPVTVAEFRQLCGGAS